MPEITMPRLSDTMEDGVIASWLKQVGDQVTRGEVLAEIETDKALMELEAYDDGVLEQILADAGAPRPNRAPLPKLGDRARRGGEPRRRRPLPRPPGAAARRGPGRRPAPRRRPRRD
ncbi:lipoyl domain-containing protein, partial [Nocardia wallacei]|uniref:lipoyl domain-containing protein n=1 Tax=Nocardia wallacei TaxID=480035 RepID=UPI002453CA88